MVMGEKGMVLAPPSLEPRVQANLRWLKPPWEAPPSRISPVLGKFLQKHAPAGPPSPRFDSGALPAWHDLYPLVARHAGVLQCLLAPQEDLEAYYLAILKAARGAGLEDPRVLSGLLWHAPLGDAQRSPERWGFLQELITMSCQGEPETNLSRADDEDAGRWAEGLAAGFAGEPIPEPAPEVRRRTPVPKNGGPAGAAEPEPGFGLDEANGHSGEGPWAELFRLTRDGLFVDRRRYEAMIYELGKLGAWQEIMKRETRENKHLREKLEGRWTRDLEYFRQLAQKNQKKGWRWWQQE
jgi:hypothetical protein